MSYNQGSNNPMFGKTLTKTTKQKMRKRKLGSKNPMWKGDSVGYFALHEWIKTRKSKPKFCPNCKQEKKLDLANISQTYKRILSDWEWLCRRCHMLKDGRLMAAKHKKTIKEGKLK